MLPNQKSLLAFVGAIALLAAGPAFAASPHLPAMGQFAQAGGPVLDGEAEKERSHTQSSDVTPPQAASLIDKRVTNATGENIGEVEAVVIDDKNETKAIIVSVGGFLGIGERSVAIDWKEVQPGAGKDALRVSLSREQLETMPEYKYPDGQKSGTIFRDPMSAGDGSYPDKSGMRDSGRPAVIKVQASGGNTMGGSGPGTAKPMDDRKPMAKDRMATPGPAVGPATDLRTGSLSANKLIGADIVNTEGDTVGEVKDVLFSDGRIDGLVAASGEFLGMGGREIRLSLDQVKVQTDPEDPKDLKVTVNMTGDQLKALPPYKAEGASMR